jgi:ATP-dependent Clp protease ATP-binding subunit ClpA
MTEYVTLAIVSGIIILLGLVYFSIRRGVRRRALHFSTEAQRAIGFARVEAEALKSSSIEAVHLLLGLLHVPIQSIVSVLPLDEHEPIRREVRERVSGGALVTYRDDLPFGEEARQVLVAAAREARALESPEIDAEHLLLGILHADTSVAALILRERGLRLETLRERLALIPQYSTQ